MTKFLGSANVQYIVATDCPDWTYSSSAISPSLTCVLRLGQRDGPRTRYQGVADPVRLRAGQLCGESVVPPFLSSVFRARSTLYSVLDSPWYTGPSMALVNGSTVGAELPEYISHAAGIVVAPASI